jgi:acetyl esterase/lipase
MGVFPGRFRYLLDTYTFGVLPMKWLKRTLFVLSFVLASTNTAFTQEKRTQTTPPATTAVSNEVEILKDVTYVSGSADERQKLDLYLPKGKKDFPIVLFLHGGGFSKGDRKEAAQFGETLAKQGIGVAAAGYRLLPEAKHPQQIQDAARAFAWLKDNSQKRGWRSDAVFVAGHSAGGHLAALLGTDEQYLKAEKLTLKDIRGVIALSGAYLVPEARSDVFGDEASRKAASPITHIKSGVPAFFLAYADKDSPGRDQLTKEFAAALLNAKTQVVVYEARDRDHSSLFTKIA